MRLKRPRQTCCVFTVPPDANGRAHILQTHARNTENGAGLGPRSFRGRSINGRARRCNRRMARPRFKLACFQAAAARLPSRRTQSAARAISKRPPGEPPPKKRAELVLRSFRQIVLPRVQARPESTIAAHVLHSYVTVTPQLRHNYVYPQKIGNAIIFDR